MVPDALVIAPPAYDPVVAWGIGGLAVLMALLTTWVLGRDDPHRRRKLALGFALLMSLSAGAAWSGVLALFTFFPPPMVILMATIFLTAFGVSFSGFGKSLALDTSLVMLVALQAFRLPLELVMHRAGTLGIMPVELSYAGYNLDIVTGATAVILGVLLWQNVHVPRWVLWVWNVLGLGCLVVIVVIAVTSSPMVRAFGDAPEHLNTWVLYFPYVWLPTVLVTLAITGHLVLTRKLLLTPRAGG